MATSKAQEKAIADQQKAEANQKAALAAFAARRGAKPATQSHPFAGNLTAKGEQIRAARASLAGTVKIIEDGKLLSEVAYSDATAIGAAVQSEIARQSGLASPHNMKNPAARYTRRIRFEVEVLVK